MKVLARAAALTGIMAVCSAHIGSPDAWYEGNAGPYRVLVQVVVPPVVPGVATVFARVFGEGVRTVTLQTNRFDAIATSPPPEAALPVKNDPGLFTAKLWVMTSGSNSVTVNVSGAKGTGSAVIPVVVVPTRRLSFDRRLGAILLAVGVFLLIGAITIVGAFVREAVLPPGEQPDSRRRYKARVAMAAAAAAFALLLFGALTWWNREDAQFGRSIYKPLRASAKLVTLKGITAIDFSITDSAWVHRGDTAWLHRRNASHWSPLIVDHGKIMHLFMVKEPDLSAFAHLHPETGTAVNFFAALPPIPPGSYRVYADIVHESGFTQTLTSRITVPQTARVKATPSDSDDAWFEGVASTTGRAALGDGFNMTFEPGNAPLIAGKEVALRFVVQDAKGKSVKLDPYMGMAGHAVVTRDDGSVFVHLHPAGTISMASQMTFLLRKPSDSIPGQLGNRVGMAERQMLPAADTTEGEVAFPYAFPKPGRYHMWVQVKRAGRTLPLTGAFILQVSPAAR